MAIAPDELDISTFGHIAYRMLMDPATAGISVETWSQVFFGAMNNFNRYMSFEDVRENISDVAREHGFTPAQRHAVVRAFEGITTS